MASATDKRPPAARHVAVAAVGHLPTDNSRSLASYNTPGDTIAASSIPPAGTYSLCATPAIRIPPEWQSSKTMGGRDRGVPRIGLATPRELATLIDGCGQRARTAVSCRSSRREIRLEAGLTHTQPQTFTSACSLIACCSAALGASRQPRCRHAGIVRVNRPLLAEIPGYGTTTILPKTSRSSSIRTPSAASSSGNSTSIGGSRRPAAMSAIISFRPSTVQLLEPRIWSSKVQM